MRRRKVSLSEGVHVQLAPIGRRFLVNLARKLMLPAAGESASEMESQRHRKGASQGREGEGEGRGQREKGWGRKKANYQRKDDVRPNEELGLVAGSRKR